MTKILFLPGSGASPDFWKPVGARLPADWPKEYFGWPGLGDQPHDPAIKGIDDLVRLVAAKMDGPVDLVAQSMGGVIAARLAIEQPQTRAPAGADRDLGRRRHGGVRRLRLARRLSQVLSARRRLDHRARHRRSAAGREDRRADAADLGRCRSDQPGRRRPASRSSASRTRVCTSSPAAITIWPDARRRGGAADRAPSRLIRRSAGVPAG